MGSEWWKNPQQQQQKYMIKELIDPVESRRGSGLRRTEYDGEPG